MELQNWLILTTLVLVIVLILIVIWRDIDRDDDKQDSTVTYVWPYYRGWPRRGRHYWPGRRHRHRRHSF